MTSPTLITAAIAINAALSAAVPIGNFALVGILGDPNGWDAADLTFQVSVDGTNFVEMKDTAGNAIDYKMATGGNVYVAVDPTLWRGVTQIKVRSGTSGVAVNQTAARVLTLILKPL